MRPSGVCNPPLSSTFPKVSEYLNTPFSLLDAKFNAALVTAGLVDSAAMANASLALFDSLAAAYLARSASVMSACMD